MSRFVTKRGNKFIEEIESMEVCKHRINEVCCNEKSKYLGEYTFMFCNSKDNCGCFENEDGIIGDE